MGQGVFEAQVVIQDKDRRIRGGCLEVIVDGSTVEQGVFAEEVGFGLGWIGGDFLTMVKLLRQVRSCNRSLAHELGWQQYAGVQDRDGVR